MVPLDRVKACGHKDCRELLPADPDNEKAAAFWPQERSVSGRVVSWQAYCKRCSVRSRRARAQAETPEARAARLAARRAKHAERMATEPEYRERHLASCRKACAKWRAENLEKSREAARRWHARRRAEDREGMNADARMYYALRQERKGKALRPHRTVIDGTLPRVLADPFRRYLLAYAVEAEIAHDEDGRPAAEPLAELLGLVPRRLRAILAGQRKVALDVVDRALLNARLVVVVDGREILRTEDLYPLANRAG